MKTRVFLKALTFILSTTIISAGNLQSAPKDRLSTPHITSSEYDYLRADEVKAGRGIVTEIAPLSSAKTLKAASAASTPRQITYTSFGGATFTLTAFDGRYVRLALPDAWLTGEGLNQQQTIELLDLADLVYAHMAEIVGGEPLDQDGQDSLLTVAVVPTLSSSGQPVDGLGQIGRKGVEINPRTLETFKTHLAVGLVPEQLLHEMSHNFDLYDLWLTYGHDWPHAWTTFLIAYTQVYSRSGSLSLDADALLAHAVEEYRTSWKQADPSLTWATCLRDQTCAGVNPNLVWAGFMLTYASGYGPRAIKTAMTFLSARKAADPQPHGSPDENNDLLDEALAQGAGADVTKDIDKLRWAVSADARARISARFTTPSPFSADGDGDGFSPADGDRDDADPRVNPAATEIPNGKDDNCNGLVDETTFVEAADLTPFAWQSPASLASPVKISGTHSAADDADGFLLNTVGPTRVRLTLKTAPGAQVTADLRHHTETGEIFQLSGTGVISRNINLDRPGPWWLQVSAQPGATFGPYEILVGPADLPSNPVTLQIAPGAATNALRITAAIDLGRNFPSPPTLVRFWARGTGFVKELPTAAGVSFDWVPPDGDLDTFFRAQLVSSGTPVSQTTIAVNRATARPPDMALRPLISFPTAVNNLDTLDFKFEVSNRGQTKADGVSVGVTMPSGLTIGTAPASRGQLVMNGNTGTLQLGDVEAGETVTLSIPATGWGVTGTLAASTVASSSGPDADLSNNASTLTVNLQSPQAPVSLSQGVYRLPLRPAGSTGSEILARGALSRVVISTAGLALQTAYASPDSSGNWPTSLEGFSVTVGGLSSILVAVAPMEQTSMGAEVCAVDFVIPDGVQTSSPVPVEVRHDASSWSLIATVQETAPALWSANGSAAGAALAQSADDYTAISQLFPAPADNTSRIALYATGIRGLSTSSVPVVRAHTAAGIEFTLPVDYAGPQGHFPGLDQFIFRLPTALSGSGQVLITIDGAPGSAVLLPVR
jgi:uncharacterized protein (TIGR03437 family)